MFSRITGFFAARTAPSPVENGNRVISTLEKLQEQADQLQKRRSVLEEKVEAELVKARGFTRDKKQQQALQCLKRKKIYMVEITNIDNLILRLMEQQGMLENQQTTVSTVATLHEAATTTKIMMKELDVARVDKMVEEISEVNDQMREISELMGKPMGTAADLDEDDLLAELDELDGVELDQDLLQPAPVPATTARNSQAAPAAPTASTPAPKKTDEELEFEALQAELA